MSIRLNLGCGDKHLDGYINVDACPPADEIVDLNVFPWPWADGSVDEIISHDWLEHVADFRSTVLEMHRILRPGGIMEHDVPHYRNPIAVCFFHPQRFSIYSFCSLEQTNRPWMWGRTAPMFERVSISVYFRGTYRKFWRLLLGFLANKWLDKWECLGLPMDSIIYRGRKLP